MLIIPQRTHSGYGQANIDDMNRLTTTAVLSNATVLQCNRTNLPQGEPMQPVTPSPAPMPQTTYQEPRPSNPFPQPATPQNVVTPAMQVTSAVASRLPMPTLNNPVQKGMKYPLLPQGHLVQLEAGWHTENPLCDVDVSAFLLDDTGKIVDDSWFVFYGQTNSPDGSVSYQATMNQNRRTFALDFSRVSQFVKRIVFVMTIDQAKEKNLNFSMLRDAYIRILENGTELVSYRIADYYNNISSMMLGEVYDHKGQWKFNAIGNGVAKDLAELCGYYGVNVE